MMETNGYWVSDGAIHGHLAMWVVRQHPYHSADGVDAVRPAIIEAAQADELFIGDGLWRARKFESVRDLEEWLTAAIGDHPQMKTWNTPRIDDGLGFKGFAFVTHNGGPPPERDFIDISALLRNTAESAWHESRRETEADRGNGAAA